MKYFLTIAFFCLSILAVAQVPPKRVESGDIYGDPVSPLYKGGNGSAYQGAGYYQKDGKYGFVYPEGVKQEAIYDNISFSANGYIVKKGERYGIADKKGLLIGEMGYDSVGTMNENAYIVKKKNEYGIISNIGAKILSVKYNKILFFNNAVSIVQAKNKDIELVFNKEEKVFPQKIQYAALYANLVVIKVDGKFGAVKDQLIVPLAYDSLFVSSAQARTNQAQIKNTVKRDSPIDKSNQFRTVNVLTVQQGNKYGLLDSDGGVIYPVAYDAVSNQDSYKYYTVKKDNLYGIYFINSKKKTGIDFDKVYADGIGYVMATKNQKAGVFDLMGKQLVDFEYDPEFIMQYSIGFRITKNKKRGIVSKDGTILVPPIYDDVDPFYESGLRDFVKVKSNEKFGLVDLKGKTIIPVAFEWIGEEKGLLKVVTVDRKFGLYDKTGKVIVPAEYVWINNSDTENSNLIVLEKGDGSYNFMHKNTKQLLLKENVSDYGYVLDEDGLLNPFSSAPKHLLYVKGKNGKFGMLNEATGLLDIPMVYDEIIQHFDNYYSVRSGKKYGLINAENKQIIPLQYDAININLIRTDDAVIVAKGNKFGTVNLKGQVQIPFQYANLERISYAGLYKAKVGKHYQIVNGKNEIINKGPFDEVAKFEENGGVNSESLTFFKGKMRVINSKGAFITPETAMLPHIGYKTFDELKWALITALDSKDDSLLKDFSVKIAPSAHILYYLKENLFSKQSLRYTDVNTVREKYYSDLLRFKLHDWNKSSNFSYNRASLTKVRDYTMYQNGFVTNQRTTDHAFGDTRFMEKVLRNAFKINGYWISSYFMFRNFDRFEP